jgi:WhiB family redox-sensing transcriptional regulator
MSEWREQAACRGMPTAWWFPEDGQPADPAARRICLGCPVRMACLTEAIERSEPDGVWGGLGPGERRRFARWRRRGLSCRCCGERYVPALPEQRTCERCSALVLIPA